jgi:hypothetical protein
MSVNKIKSPTKIEIIDVQKKIFCNKQNKNYFFFTFFRCDFAAI